MSDIYDSFKVITYDDAKKMDKSPTSEEIEKVLGQKMDPKMAEFIDSITGQEAADLLEKLLDAIE